MTLWPGDNPGEGKVAASAFIKNDSGRQARSVEEALANDPNYVVIGGLIRRVKDRTIDLAVVQDGVPKILYDVGRGLSTAIDQSDLAGYLSRKGIQPVETIANTFVPDVYAGAGDKLLLLASRLRGAQEQMTTEELRRGQQ